MSLTFPNSPSTNDSHVTGGSTWIFNGEMWVRQGTGSQGVQGLQGLKGSQGVQGLSNQGVQGLQGILGTAGSAGSNGSQGVQGTTGPDGGNAGTLDNLDSTQFLRSDVADDKTDGRLKFSNNVNVEFGDNSALTIYANPSNSYITNSNGTLYIGNSDDDEDIIIQTDNGSGGTANYFVADGSTGEVFSITMVL